MKTNKNPPLVLLEWEDSAQPKPAWVFLSDLKDPHIVKCVSVGWLIHDGEEVKELAPNLGNFNDSDEPQGCGIIRIPSRCVTRKVDLKETE